MPLNQLIATFNGGEISPFLDGRTDIEKYRSSCQTLENFIPLPYGGVVRSPGTQFCGRAKFSDKRFCVRPFVFSDTTRYVMEFGHQYVRFWQYGLPVETQSAFEWTALIPVEDGEPTDPMPYEAGQFVTHEGTTYLCLVSHTTAGDFDDDLDAGYWVEQTAVEVFTPYTADDLLEVQFVQVNDIIFFVHQNYPPQRLIRLAVDRFKWEETPFDGQAFLDENTGPNTIEASGTTGAVTLTVTASDFEKPYLNFSPDSIGSYLRIGHVRASSTIAKTFAANGSTAGVKVLGSWSLNTYGTWAGTLTIERSDDGGGSWYEIRSYTASSDRNIATAGNELKEALLRLTFSNRTVGTSTDRALLSIDDPVEYGVVKITGIDGTNGEVSDITVTNRGRGYTSTPAVTITGGGGTGATAVAVMELVSESFGKPPFVSTFNTYRVQYIRITNPGTGYTSNPTVTIAPPALSLYPYRTTATATAAILFVGADATAEVINDLASTEPTTIWAESAWSKTQGYPRSIAVHEGRVVYGGTAARPQSIAGSRIDDFQNFRTGSLADDAIYFTIASRTTNLVQWMASKDGSLFVGKLDAEGQISSGSADAAISPDSVAWTDTTKFGSAHIPAVELNDSLFFLQGQSRKIRELAFDNNRQAYGAPDVTLLAEHITRTGIVDWAAQQQQEAIIWAVRGDGQLAGLTWERDQDVKAWHRRTTAGEFESVCTVPGEYGDELWLAVKRTIGGETVRCVERFFVDWREQFENENKAEWRYLDCAIRVQNSPSNDVISGLEHLEGATVQVLADGAYAGEHVVTDGSVTIEFACAVALVGLPYESTIRPMKLDQVLQSGTAQGRRAKVNDVKLRVLKSLGGQYSTDGKEFFDILSRSTDDEMDDSPPPFTGDTEKLVDDGNWGDSAQVWIRQNKPMPLTILGMIVNWSPSQQ